MIVDIEALHRVAYCDESGGKTKSRRTSRSAIIVVGQDAIERVFILSCFIAHCTTNQLLDQIFQVNDTWLPVVFGIDATGNQVHFADTLRREQQLRNKQIPQRDCYMEEDKTTRIESGIQPLAAAHKLFRPPEMEVLDLKGEWQAFPKVNAYRDGLDALAGAISLLPRRLLKEQADRSDSALKKYLEQSGAPASYIHQRFGYTKLYSNDDQD